jgi:hypothetical protein
MAVSVQSEKQKNGGQRSHEMAMSGVQIRQVFQEQVFLSFILQTKMAWRGNKNEQQGLD